MGGAGAPIFDEYLGDIINASSPWVTLMLIAHGPYLEQECSWPDVWIHSKACILSVMVPQHVPGPTLLGGNSLQFVAS